MQKSLYNRSLCTQYFLNSTELLAYAVTARPQPDGICRLRKLPYGSEKQQYYNLQIKTEKSETKKPLFVYIHGGGWLSGIMNMRDLYVSEWAKNGFYAVSLSYTYAPQKVFPAQIAELCKALDTILDEADNGMVDSSQTVIAAESAGVYYMLYLASMLTDDDFYKKTNIEFRHRNDIRIRTLISNCGCFQPDKLLDARFQQSHFALMKNMVTGFLGKEKEEAVAWLQTEEGKQAIPVVNPSFPPVFVAWATMDLLRFESFDLMKLLKENGVPFTDYKCSGIIGMHAWNIATVLPSAKECFEFALAYAKSWL